MSVVVSSLAILLSRIPVRLVIHSSDVSILVESQSFVTRAAGRQLPVPIILLLISSSMPLSGEYRPPSVRML